MQQDKEDIRELQEDRDNVTHRLDRIEKELDSLERLSKHFSLKFLGVTEGLRQNCRTSIERIVDILKDCSSSRTCNKSVTETACRIEDRRQRSGQPRPLIVTFHRWSDKMEILNDTSSRDLLRREGIRVSSELTTRQRDEVQRYRRQGKIAYY